MTGSSEPRSQDGCGAEFRGKGRNVNEVVTKSELKPICERLDSIEKKLDTIYNVWMQAQGGARFAKILFFTIGSMIGAFFWLRDHIKF